MTAYVVGLYPSNSDRKELEILQKNYKKHPNSRIPTGGTKMAEFVLKTHLFEFLFQMLQCNFEDCHWHQI